MWSGLVGIVSKYEEWGSSGPGRSDMCLVCLSYSIACVQYGMCPVWGVSVWGVSVWGPAVTGCRRTHAYSRQIYIIHCEYSLFVPRKLYGSVICGGFRHGKMVS